jgi:hypothetical protein
LDGYVALNSLPNDFSYKFDTKGLYAEDVLTAPPRWSGLPSDMVGIVAAQSIAEPAHRWF